MRDERAINCYVYLEYRHQPKTEFKCESKIRI